jgi:hypothetical protein
LKIVLGFFLQNHSAVYHFLHCYTNYATASVV